MAKTINKEVRKNIFKSVGEWEGYIANLYKELHEDDADWQFIHKMIDEAEEDIKILNRLLDVTAVIKEDGVIYARGSAAVKLVTAIEARGIVSSFGEPAQFNPGRIYKISFGQAKWPDEDEFQKVYYVSRMA